MPGDSNGQLNTNKNINEIKSPLRGTARIGVKRETDCALNQNCSLVTKINWSNVAKTFKFCVFSLSQSIILMTKLNLKCKRSL